MHMNPDRGSGFIWTDGQTNILDIMWPELTHLPILRWMTTYMEPPIGQVTTSEHFFFKWGKKFHRGYNTYIFLLSYIFIKTHTVTFSYTFKSLKFWERRGGWISKYYEWTLQYLIKKCKGILSRSGYCQQSFDNTMYPE